MDGTFDGPVVTEFAVVLSNLQSDLLDLVSWFFFVKGLEDADDVGPAVWTLNLLMILLRVDLEDAIGAEGVPAGHSHSEVLGLNKTDATLLIIQPICVCKFRLKDRCANDVDLLSEVRLDHILPQLAQHQPAYHRVHQHHEPTHSKYYQIRPLTY